MWIDRRYHIFYKYRCAKICISVLGFLMIFLVIGCKDKSDPLPPAIHFKNAGGYLDSNCTAAIGRNFKLGIIAIAGDEAITNLIITVTTDKGSGKALDSGLYTHLLNLDKTITYGAEAYEKWTFTVRDKNGKTAAVSFVLTRDSNSGFGKITYYPSITLGAQNNPADGHFLFLPSGKTAFIDSSTSHQAETYMAAYFGESLSPPTSMTFSSPGETDLPSFYSAISGWNLPRNEIRYKADSLTVSNSEFDACSNDSLIISNYTATAAGKRKFKWVQAGYVIPFQVMAGSLAGKRGLIRVKSLVSGNNGKIVFDIKIQK